MSLVKHSVTRNPVATGSLSGPLVYRAGQVLYGYPDLAVPVRSFQPDELVVGMCI